MDHGAHIQQYLKQRDDHYKMKEKKGSKLFMGLLAQYQQLRDKSAESVYVPSSPPAGVSLRH